MATAREIITALGGNQRSGMCRCPAHDDNNPSLKVSDDGKQVLVHCHAGCSQERVIDELRIRGLWHVGNRGRPPSAERAGVFGGTEEIAEELLDAAEEIGKPPCFYLEQRGINRTPKALKLVGVEVTKLLTGVAHPAIISPITDQFGCIIGTHATYLTSDLRYNVCNKHRNLRRMYGKSAGGLIVLKPAKPDRPFILGEGVESVLSAMQITGYPGASALSASNLPKVNPPKCSEVIIAADADEAGTKAAELLATRLASTGYKVRIALPLKPGNDWNDELRAHGATARLKRQLMDAPFYEATANDNKDTFLADIMPWPGLVKGNEVLDELVAIFNRHMLLPKGAAESLALWTIHCHAHDSAQHSPLLFLSSPTKRCGKTNLLSVLQLLVPKPLPAANLTPAVLFRSIDKWKPTLLIDEADTFIADKSELHGVLNSGHRRSQAKVLRCVGDDFTPTPFSTWCPKAFAAIGRVTSTLEDRSIIIELQRKQTAIHLERVPIKDDAYDTIRRKAARWAIDSKQRLENSDPKAPNTLSDRARDNWNPLFAIADLAGADWPDRARNAALQLSLRDDDEGEAEMLLRDLRCIFDRRRASAIFTEEIIEDLIQLEGRPWADLSRGKPINAHTLARRMKPFGIFPRKMRIASSKRKCSAYERKRLEPIWQRYICGNGKPR